MGEVVACLVTRGFTWKEYSTRQAVFGRNLAEVSTYLNTLLGKNIKYI